MAQVVSRRPSSKNAAPKLQQSEFVTRLNRFWKELAPNSVAIIVSNPERTRSNDTEFTYRQSSDLLYLNNFPEPNSALVVCKLSGDNAKRFIMFVQPKDKAQEIWTGIRIGPEGAKDSYLADDAYTFDQFESVVRKLVSEANTTYYRFGVNDKFDDSFRKVWGDTQKELRNPETIVHEMRLFKSKAELTMLRKACAISAEAHSEAMKATRPGMKEYELQALIEYIFRSRGAQYVAYGSIVANGNNAVVLHYTSNEGDLVDGDLVLVDAGSEYGGYASDITRTWPVSGKFTAAQKEVYELVLKSQLAAIDAAKPGAALIEVHEAASKVLRKGLIKLGVLPSTSSAKTDQEVLRQRSEDKKKGADTLVLRDFFMHGTSHWMGLDVHDVGSYDGKGGSNNRNKAGKRRLLEPGMVFTVEPGLYFDKDDTRVPAKYRGIGIRIEDDVFVTDDGCEVLTAGVPKSVKDIEALMASEA